MYERYANLLKEKNITSYTVSKETGVSQSVLSDWKNGKCEPKIDKLYKIAKFFDVSIDYLLGESNERTLRPEKSDHMVQLPLYSCICCGNGGFVDDNIIEYISLPDSILSHNKEYFAQYAKGDSMIDANINEGDLLVFEKCQHLENGQIGCFCIDENDAVCKKYYHDFDTGIITLQACNINYPPKTITVENTCFKILGRLSGVYSKR